MLNEDIVRGARGAAEFVGIPTRQIYHLVEGGHLPVIRMGKTLFFRKSELEAVFRSPAREA